MSTSQESKSALLPLLLSNSVLTFGIYTLKSGRQSPYFFTSSLLHTAPLLRQTAASYASVLSSPPFASGSAGKPDFDVLFGPAYKGIPLCAAVVTELAYHEKRFDHVSYSFNRKEAKAHGEGGSIVGCPLKGKRVVILDDVITAGTALREAVSIIQAEGGVVVGVVVLLDRQERVSDDESRSAVGVAEATLSVPVRAVVTLNDLIETLGPAIGEGEIGRMKEYRAEYGSKS